MYRGSFKIEKHLSSSVHYDDHIFTDENYKKKKIIVRQLANKERLQKTSFMMLRTFRLPMETLKNFDYIKFLWQISDIDIAHAINYNFIECDDV